MAGLVFLVVLWVLAGACQRNGVFIFHGVLLRSSTSSSRCKATRHGVGTNGAGAARRRFCVWRFQCERNAASGSPSIGIVVWYCAPVTAAPRPSGLPSACRPPAVVRANSSEDPPRRDHRATGCNKHHRLRAEPEHQNTARALLAEAARRVATRAADVRTPRRRRRGDATRRRSPRDRGGAVAARRARLVGRSCAGGSTVLLLQSPPPLNRTHSVLLLLQSRSPPPESSSPQSESLDGAERGVRVAQPVEVLLLHRLPLAAAAVDVRLLEHLFHNTTQRTWLWKVWSQILDPM